MTEGFTFRIKHRRDRNISENHGAIKNGREIGDTVVLNKGGFTFTTKRTRRSKKQKIEQVVEAPVQVVPKDPGLELRRIPREKFGCNKKAAGPKRTRKLSDKRIGRELHGEIAYWHELFCLYSNQELAALEKQYVGSQAIVVDTLYSIFNEMKEEFSFHLKKLETAAEKEFLPNEENKENCIIEARLRQRLKGLKKQEMEWEEIARNLMENGPVKTDADDTADSQLASDRATAEISATDPTETTDEQDGPFQIESGDTMEDLEEIEAKVSEVMQKFQTDASLLQASMKSVNRLLARATTQKDELFDAVHAQKFQGYSKVDEPKSLIQGLLSTS